MRHENSSQSLLSSYWSFTSQNQPEETQPEVTLGSTGSDWSKIKWRFWVRFWIFWLEGKWWYHRNGSDNDLAKTSSDWSANEIGVLNQVIDIMFTARMYLNLVLVSTNVHFSISIIA